MGERLFASVLLVVACPVILSAAIIIWVISRQSPFIAHQRVAKGGGPLWVLKLRTMWTGQGTANRLVELVSASKPGSVTAKKAHDPRVTSAFAAFCRRYSIDELPQLWHVVRGDMALVGPRPLTRFEVDRYYGRQSAELLTRKPGVTGLWQISGRSRLDYRQRRRLDLFLVRRWSAGLYFRILTLTPSRVLSGKDAW